MRIHGSRIPTSLAVLLGAITGWTLSTLSTAPIHASAGDRSGDVITATGPVLMRFDEGVKAPISLDALYLLDYRGGRLLASVPTFSQIGKKVHMIEKFLERDLTADFELEKFGVSRPRFLMTTGGLGPYHAGWSPLYVFETTSSQVAVYKVQVAQTIGPNSGSHFDLVEKTTYSKTAAAPVAEQP
jgi:hypothetical protein